MAKGNLIPYHPNLNMKAEELHHLRAESLKWAPAKTVDAASELIRLKNKKGPWDVIDKILKIWQSTNPKEYRSHLIQLEETKATRKVTNIGGKQFSGVSKDKVSGAILRYTLDIPEKVVYMIRRIYTPEQLPMDKKFYNKWGKRYPNMVISQVV